MEEADALIAPVEAEVRRRLGSVFGADDETLERLIFDGLQSRGWTIGTAESATGGMIVSRLTAVPGASDFVRGSVVSYATDVKEQVLGVPAETLAAGVVSEETALAMASGARRVLQADVAIAVTGSAGPDPQEHDVGS